MATELHDPAKIIRAAASTTRDWLQNVSCRANTCRAALHKAAQQSANGQQEMTPWHLWHFDGLLTKWHLRASAASMPPEHF